MKSSHLITLALACGGITVVACGDGGPGSLTFGSGYETVQHSTLDGPTTPATGATGTKTGTTKGDDDDDDTTTKPPTTTVDAGTTTPTNCPVCATYSCTGPAGTGDVALAQGGKNACTTSVNGEPISIDCGNKITGADGNTVGAWQSTGTGITVVLTTTDGTQTITCTKK